MKKLPVIELREYEIEEIDGEFLRKVVSAERHPLYFSNYSLLVGKQNGILEKGLEQELFGMLSVIDKDSINKFSSGQEVDSETAIKLTELLSLDHMKDIIWLAYVGARSGECIGNEEFKEKYDEDFQTVISTYMEILVSNFRNQGEKNSFKSGLTKSVAKPIAGGKK